MRKTRKMSSYPILAIMALCVILVLSINLVSALVIYDVDSDTFYPGKEGLIRIKVENNLNEDIEGVSLSLNLENLPFSASASTEDNVGEIDDGDKETFSFRLRASNEASPGDYNIPYTIIWENATYEKTGTIGVKLRAESELDFSILTENSIVGEKGRVILKIVNKGLGDAKFLSIKLLPSGYTLLSESDIYIGTVNSDDFETASFNVIFKKQNADFEAKITYKEYDNTEKTENVLIPLKVYSKEKALEIGLIKKSYTYYYVAGIVAFILFWIVYKKLKKKARQRKIQNGI